MVNTMVKTLDGVIMENQLNIRIENDLKEKFREAAEMQNPHLPKGKAVSIVLRELMINYINAYENRKNQPKEG